VHGKGRPVSPAAKSGMSFARNLVNEWRLEVPHRRAIAGRAALPQREIEMQRSDGRPH
jgi:hypothetical protein